MPDDSQQLVGEPTERQQMQVRVTYDKAITYAFQQNAIPIIKDLVLQNDDIQRQDLQISIQTEPEFASPTVVRLQALAPGEEFRFPPIDLKLSHEFLSTLNEKVSGWIKIDVTSSGSTPIAIVEPISLLARNEWCGLASLPEILAAFILPNDPAVMTILSRASELLRENTGRGSLTGYQEKNRKRVWEQVAAIYRAVGELRIRYIVAPASFETTGQKVRLPSDIVEQRFGNCLDLTLLFAACCEQAGLHPLVLIHDGHAYAGCWLEQHTMPQPSSDDLQHIRKLVTDDLAIVFESTTVASESPGTLKDAELDAKAHLQTQTPFRLALDVRRSRMARIHPLPIPRDVPDADGGNTPNPAAAPSLGLGNREISEWTEPTPLKPPTAASRIDHWKSRLLDLSLRNRLLNFKETKATVQVLSAAPEEVEDELAAERELSLQPKPKLMGETDPRNAAIYTKQQRADALTTHLHEEFAHGRLHTTLDEAEHSRRLTQLYRAARTGLEENGTNTLFAAVGILEWRETEHSDRVLRAPLLLVPVELKRKSVIEGFSLRRIDEDTRLNVTLMEMLRQHFQMNIAGLDPLPEDESGVDVARVLQLFREAVRNLPGWEVQNDIWLGLFSFTKFLLWEDMSSRVASLIKSPIVDHLVNRAGQQYPNRGEDIRPSELDDRFHPREVFCPRSADSSQLAAVMAAADGQDFVLEGPPGTGKSQTITNLIAHCLAEKKRILFVAEKRAALDVVHRRLREVGLDPFCLELHSNKAGKADVLAQFDRSLKFVSARTDLDWEYRTMELERLRKSLNDYSRALHQRHPCGLSAFHCLDYLVPRKSDPTVRLDQWRSITETPLTTLEHARTLARQMQERSRGLMPLTDHGLAPLACDEWSPTWAEDALVRIRDMAAVTQTAIDASNALCEWLQRPHVGTSRADLSNMGLFCLSLGSPKSVGPAFATTPWPQLSRSLGAWVSLVAERQELRLTLARIQEPRNSTAMTSPCESWTPDFADIQFRDAADLNDLATRALNLARDMRTLLQAARESESRNELASLAELTNCLLDVPADIGSIFAIAHWDSSSKQLERWITLARERVALRSRLTAYGEATLLALDLEELDRVWQSSKSAWLLPKWMRSRHVRRSLQPARLNGAQPELAEIEDVLKCSRRLRDVNAELSAAHSAAVSLLGVSWDKGEPDPEVLQGIRNWGAVLHQRMRAVAAEDSAWLQPLSSSVGGLLGKGRAQFADGGALGDRLRLYRNTVIEFDRAYLSLSASAALRRGPLDSAANHLEAVSSALGDFKGAAPRLRAINAELAASALTAELCLGVTWANGEPSAAEISEARQWGEVFHARMLACAGDDMAWLSKFRGQVSGLFSEGPNSYARGTVIGDRLLRFGEAQAQFETSLSELTALLRIRRDAIDSAPDHLDAVLCLARRVEGAWPRIRDWCSWQRTRREGAALGLAPVIAELEGKTGPLVQAPALFERSFRRALLFATIEQSPALREFFGREHDERIEQFREVDDKLSGLTSDLVQARLAAAIPRDQGRGDLPTAEIGLLRKELGKKTRHIPVRKLLNGIPTLLPRLKPCVLMSPLSVAQYLDTNQEQFDVVVFDEASQIPVWDAIGAIARGKQLIVVGDPKQLPPTNFFNTQDEDEDDLTPDEHKDLESILDELLSNGVRHKRLQWHYRSRQEGLITFSNRLYYENDLLTFPSPTTGHGGVRFKYLPNARYDKGKSRTNRGEAEALVSELVTRLRKSDGPARSYGVVTFSQAQQNLIENLLDEERRKNPEIEAHFGDDSPVEGEYVFVKNLENVQGDERDVILFSICYGPDETGRVSMNFGPLNRDGGERRLNVAITRAKHEVLVISGLRADQIDLARTRARGVRDLKYFLDYAERGPRALMAATSASSDSEPDSEFERMVADRIRAAGFEVHHQVGCSGYRIDLGVVDPAAPGNYLLGIECDGATYHRAATARDRDKLRQAVLEDLGWELHRVWSTDWWHDADSETAKLLARLQDVQRGTARPVPESHV